MKKQSIAPDIISWPAGSTYEIVLDTNVHAHPATPGFRTKYDCPFMTFREKGGFMKYLFYVESKVVCDPKDIKSLQHGLSPDEYDRLCRYVKTRDVSDFGFGSNSAYIFYLLKNVADIKQPFARPGVQSHLYYYLEDVPIVDAEEEIVFEEAQEKKIDATRIDPLNDRQLGIISIDNSPEFDRIYEIINACTGRNLKGYQRASYPLNKGFHLWFPKLPETKNGQLIPWDAGQQWVNVLSPDGKEICMKNAKGPVNIEPRRRGQSLWITFAKKNNSPYRYIGTFCPDYDRSSEDGLILVRVADRIDISGFDL